MTPHLSNLILLTLLAVKPTVRVDPMISNINEGESVSVNCLATGKPTPTYIWKFLSDIPGEFLLALAGGGGNS